MTPAKVLIVEDDRIVAMDIKGQLIRIGHTVVGVTGRGEDVLQLALDTTPELVLMDIRLEGEIDGVEAAEQIRDQLRIPVIFLTAYADDRTVERASLTEPFGYLLKPFEDLQLRTAVEMALYKHAAESKLRASERRFVTTLSSIGEAVIATDDQSLVTFMNPVAEALTGWSLRDALGVRLDQVFQIVNEHSGLSVEDPAVKILRLGAVAGLANHTMLLARDGRQVPIDNSGSPIIDDRGKVTGAVLVFRDITERRRLEEVLRSAHAELLRASRLASMSELAASIADEVNQPLTAIVTDADTCVLWLSRDPPECEQALGAARRVVQDSHRAADVMRSIRRLMQKRAPSMTSIDMKEVIRDILDLLEGDLHRHNVTLETDLWVEPMWVLGDRIQLQQVMVNLVLHAVEAMSHVTSWQRILRVSAAHDDASLALISIEDTGAGLDASSLERLFNPIFASERGGMSIELSICRSIIEAHGGKVSASQRKPHGSTIRFTLPRVTHALAG